jgi:hypothetical protein
MTSRMALIAVLFCVVLFLANANAQNVLMGTTSVQSTNDSDSAGQAEAFRTIATSNGTITSVSVYLDRSNRARKVFVGIYSDKNGRPQTLLGSGATSSPVAGQWNTVAITPAVSVIAGAAYHETVLGTGGTIQYRDTGRGSHSETSAQTDLSSLPNSWSSGQTWPSSPLSLYGIGSAGSGGSGNNVSVAVSPTSASVVVGGTQQFNATVSGSSNTGVNWSVINGGGSINLSGLYTAPPNPGSATVQAQSQADTTKTATAGIAITSSVAVSVTPATAAVPEGGTQQFTARVSGTSNTNVNWSLSGAGALSSSGLYTAPNAQGSAAVTATSVADPSKYASANVTVSAVSISISPISATVQPSGTQQFTASVLGATNTNVTWSETGSGSVNANGLYTAPSTSENNDTVTATSVADSTKSASASVTVQQQSASQCGNRLDWTNSVCQQIGQGQLNTAIVNGASSPNAWTVISRHGEYAQSETECNVPGAIGAGNGQLTITTSNTPATCGDFNTDGTGRTSPARWPYSTGDLQWNTFNFKYGTVIYSASVPSSATDLWPGLLWMLTSACQTTNKYSGDTGFSGCPNAGSSGYTEIDPFECYNGNVGWCQFHVANPGFGIGGGCDASIPIRDTDFHTIMLIWTPSSIKQYTDGVLKSTCNQSLSSPMFLIVQTQTGGVGGTPENSLLPTTAAMRYVKVCSSTDGSCATVHDNDATVEFVDRFGGPAQ